MRPTTKIAFLVFAGVALTVSAGGEFRFPMPDFESGYEHPEMHTPQPARSHDVLDMAVLAACLSLATWFALKARSRAGLFALTIFSLLYFGFWRQGCVCPVGSVQNMIAAMADPTVDVPLVVLVFFLLPLIFALFFGRVFCAAVCPLGAVQELVAIYPVNLPRRVDHLLGLFRYVYLGLAVLGVVTGAGYLICRYDPFVGFFRLGANYNMFLVGGVFLAGGVFIGRPYCRFLCPYGAILGWMSRFSKWHAKIPPTECIQCRLCEDACPYNAIKPPQPADPPETRRQGARRFAILLVTAPIIVGFGAWVGLRSHDYLARLHPTVRLSERIVGEEAGRFPEMTIESEAFRGGKQTQPQLHEEARAVRQDFSRSAEWLGAFLGLVVVCKLISLSVMRRRCDYEPDRAGCVSCGRCYAYCPVEEKTR